MLKKEIRDRSDSSQVLEVKIYNIKRSKKRLCLKDRIPRQNTEIPLTENGKVTKRRKLRQMS